MTHINEIKLMNDATITYLRKTNQNTKRNELIDKILKDEACFFKMTKEDGIMILTSVGISEEKAEKVYMDLISKEEYYNLQQRGKIAENDENLKIKYPKYNANSLF